MKSCCIFHFFTQIIHDSQTFPGIEMNQRQEFGFFMRARFTQKYLISLRLKNFDVIFVKILIFNIGFLLFHFI
jgi:hypothetical protein